MYINSLSSILPNNKLCDDELIKEMLYEKIDQVAFMWIYVWGRLNPGEKKFIIYLLESDGANRFNLDKNLGYAKSSISRFIDSLSNKGIIEFNGEKFILADKMLERWLKTKCDNIGYYPF